MHLLTSHRSKDPSATPSKPAGAMLTGDLTDVKNTVNAGWKATHAPPKGGGCITGHH